MNDNEKNEKAGVHAVGGICSELGWCFREQPILDYGVDAIIELIDDKRNSVNLIALQIKCGESYFNEIKNDYVVFRFEEPHKRYWETYQIPVVIVLYNKNDRTLIYKVFKEEDVVACDGGYKLLISKKASFEEFLKQEAKVVRKIPEYIYNYNYMLTQLPFIQKIKEGYDVVLNSEEWVNKSSGRGHIYLEIIKGDKKEEYHWNYWFPYQLYPEVFLKLFPWANFEADEDYSDEGFEEEYNEINAIRLLQGKALLDFDERIKQIKCTVSVGEVAFYKLYLSVNDFGEAFYLTHNTLMNMKAYKGLQISSDIE